MNILTQIGRGTAETGELMEVVGFNGESLTDEESQKPFFTVLGKDSNKFRDVKQLIQNEITEAMGKNSDYTDPKGAPLERRIRLVGACVVDWDNISNEHNQPLECTVENVEMLLESSPYLLDLVDDFLSNRENYLVKP